MPTVSTSEGKLSGNGTADTVGNQSLAEPHPDHLRNFVLDYLCHNCYLKTAEAFTKDSAVRHLDEDGDEIDDSASEGMGNGLDATSSLGPSTNLSDEMVRHILLRQRIQFEILSGNVHEATDLLNRHFPRVLAVDDSGENSSEMEVADENAGDLSRLEYVAETVNPVHLSLNLRILAFIEACRTVPLVYPGSLPSERGSAGRRSPVSFPDSDSDIVMVVTPSAAAKHATREEESYQAELLICVQKLYATVNALGKSEDRTIYLKELSNVGGLLAYAVPENSPMVKYLHQERRDRVAEQINSAILHHAHMPSVSYLERVVRYTHCLWGMLHELRAKVPAAHRPRGVSPLLGTGSQGAREPDKETFYEARPFDLQLFLNTRT